jgi:hypothetical protein
VASIFFVLLYQVDTTAWVYWARKLGLYATFAFTLFSGIHYAFLTGQRLRAQDRQSRAATR